MDRENLIDALALIAWNSDPKNAQTITAAISLLKEQDAVTVHDPGAYCPKCGWMLYPEDHPHNCGNCGQMVKWE